MAKVSIQAKPLPNLIPKPDSTQWMGDIRDKGTLEGPEAYRRATGCSEGLFYTEEPAGFGTCVYTKHTHTHMSTFVWGGQRVITAISCHVLSALFF